MAEKIIEVNHVTMKFNLMEEKVDTVRCIMKLNS